MIFLVLSVLQGVWSFFAFQLRSIMRPINTKFVHYILSLICFIVGMMSLISGYRYGDTHDLLTAKSVEYTLIGIAVITSVLSLIGVAKSIVNYINNNQVPQKTSN